MATKKQKSKRALAKEVPAGIHYFDAVRNWRKISRHLDNVILQNVLVENFNKYTYGRSRRKFQHGQCPRDFEATYWYEGWKGREPSYWRYVKHAACHWLVNFNLMLATLVEPKRKWRIITSDKHSTVWDGQTTLFELNYQAFGIAPAECFQAAYQEEMSPGVFLKIGYAIHYTKNLRRG